MSTGNSYILENKLKSLDFSYFLFFKRDLFFEFFMPSLFAQSVFYCSFLALSLLNIGQVILVFYLGFQEFQVTDFNFEFLIKAANGTFLSFFFLFLSFSLFLLSVSKFEISYLLDLLVYEKFSQIKFIGMKNLSFLLDKHRIISEKEFKELQSKLKEENDFLDFKNLLEDFLEKKAFEEKKQKECYVEKAKERIAKETKRDLAKEFLSVE